MTSRVPRRSQRNGPRDEDGCGCELVPVPVLASEWSGRGKKECHIYLCTARELPRFLELPGTQQESRQDGDRSRAIDATRCNTSTGRQSARR